MDTFAFTQLRPTGFPCNYYFWMGKFFILLTATFGDKSIERSVHDRDMEKPYTMFTIDSEM